MRNPYIFSMPSQGGVHRRLLSVGSADSERSEVVEIEQRSNLFALIGCC